MSGNWSLDANSGNVTMNVTHIVYPPNMTSNQGTGGAAAGATPGPASGGTPPPLPQTATIAGKLDNDNKHLDITFTDTNLALKGSSWPLKKMED